MLRLDTSWFGLIERYGFKQPSYQFKALKEIFLIKPQCCWLAFYRNNVSGEVGHTSSAVLTSLEVPTMNLY
jgi:hypothetical protein